MSDAPADTVEAQLRQLLQVVARHRDERCNELLGQARREAGQVISQAHAEARVRLHQSIQGIREERRLRLAAAEAQLQTHRRRRRESADLWLLAAAWQPLRKALLARWSQETARRQWIDFLVHQACTLLVATDWQIEHPLDWPVRERATLEERLAGQLGRVPEFIPREDLAAGLRVCANGTCVDATLEGLLRDQTRIESLLLARFNADVAIDG
jgi:F0F1-type ATP synthase membrane subunit b/b'